MVHSPSLFIKLTKYCSNVVYKFNQLNPNNIISIVEYKYMFDFTKLPLRTQREHNLLTQV